MTTTSRTLSLALLLTLAACSGVVATPDTTDAGDPPGTTEADAGSSTTTADESVPVELQPFDCARAGTETMGASPDTTATFQIWLDGAQLYDCHGANAPPCPSFGGKPPVYDCIARLL